MNCWSSTELYLKAEELEEFRLSVRADPATAVLRARQALSGTGLFMRDDLLDILFLNLPEDMAPTEELQAVCLYQRVSKPEAAAAREKLCSRLRDVVSSAPAEAPSQTNADSLATERELYTSYLNGTLLAFIPEVSDRLSAAVEKSRFYWLTPEELPISVDVTKTVNRGSFVDGVKILLSFCEALRGRVLKETACRIIMAVAAQNVSFAISEPKFFQTVIQKLDDFARQDALPWAQKLRDKLAPLYVGPPPTPTPEPTPEPTLDPAAAVQGFKGFTLANGLLNCRGYTYKIGRQEFHKGTVGAGRAGFHYCKSFADVLSHYPVGPDTVYCRVVDNGTQRSATNAVSATNAIFVSEYLHGEYTEGGVTWHFSEGRQHNDTGPAYITANTKHWYINGQLSRVDGPAIENTDGSKEYYLDGKRHRLDGPAIERADSKEYYLNGERHRLDGPAIERDNGRLMHYYVNGQLHRDGGPAYVDERGVQYWYQHGQLDREDGPAIDGPHLKEWYSKGRRHRVGAPAATCVCGAELWSVDGVVTRSDGPAVVYYYKDGVKSCGEEECVSLYANEECDEEDC